MAAHGEKTWPSVGNFNGRQRGGSHGHRQCTQHLWIPPAISALQ